MSFFSFSFRYGRSRKARAARSKARAHEALTLLVEILEDRITPSGMQTLVETAMFPTAVTPTPTNFNLQGTVQQFDPSLGVLQSVVITEQGTVNSTIGVENTSTSSASQITATVSGKLEVTGPGVDLTVTPSDNLATFDATTFDGTIDFAGTSGKTYPTSSASGTQSLTLTGSAVGPFISAGTGPATGTVALTEIGAGTSTASGTGGNLQVTTTNTATAVVTVTYNYLPLSTLSGYVYYDTGTSGPGSTGYNDGIRESNEPPPQKPMYVYLIGTNYQGQSVNTYTLTDANGFYSFANLEAGAYAIIRGVDHDANAVDGKNTIGTQGGKTLGDEFYNIALAGGVNGINNDFGLLLPATIIGADFPDVSIVKTASPSQVLVGGTLTYTLTVSNVGTGNAQGLTVTDVLPNGIAVYSMAGAGWSFTLTGQTVTATLPSLAEGAQSVITIGVYAPPTPGNITNTATLTETSPDSDLNDKKSSVTTPVVAPPSVPFPPAVFAVPSGTFSKSQLLGNGGSIGNLDPTTQGQLVYVESLYQTLYGQPPTQGALISFVQQLRQGVSPAQIVRQFWLSQQHFANEVAYYFQVYYHRAPTAAETTTWTNIFNAGYSETTVQWMLASSAEYNADHPTDASFVNGLYLDALGRAANVLEESYWQSFIAAHGRSAAAYAILQLPEYYVHQVDLVYNAWLNRESTSTELASWVTQLEDRKQIGLSNVYMSLLSSTEFYNLTVKKTGVA